MVRHPQGTVQTADGDVFEVDDNLVEMITAMWDLGIQTRSSCQDYLHEPGFVMVGIDGAAEVQVFLDVVYDEELMDDWEMKGWTDGSPVLLMDITFPREQLGRVTEMLAAARRA